MFYVIFYFLQCHNAQNQDIKRILKEATLNDIVESWDDTNNTLTTNECDFIKDNKLWMHTIKYIAFDEKFKVVQHGYNGVVMLWRKLN